MEAGRGGAYQPLPGVWRQAAFRAARLLWQRPEKLLYSLSPPLALQTSPGCTESHCAHSRGLFNLQQTPPASLLNSLCTNTFLKIKPLFEVFLLEFSCLL